MQKKKAKVEIDGDTTVIIEVHCGVVVDYYNPKGIHVIVIDKDSIEAGQKPDATTQAAITNIMYLWYQVDSVTCVTSKTVSALSLTATAACPVVEIPPGVSTA